jgi:hypothetical protein
MAPESTLYHHKEGMRSTFTTAAAGRMGARDNVKVSRQSLEGSGFPGRAWEPGAKREARASKTPVPKLELGNQRREISRRLLKN